MYLGESYSLIRNITSTLPEEPKFGMRPWMFTDYELEMLLGCYQWGLPTLTSCFLCGICGTNTLMTRTDPSLQKNTDCSLFDFFTSKVSNSPSYRSLKLHLFQGRQPTQTPGTTKTMLQK